MDEMDGLCGRQADDGSDYVCTLLTGHVGRHVARIGVSGKVVATWQDQPGPMIPPPPDRDADVRLNEIRNWAAKVVRAHTYASENADTYRAYDRGYADAQKIVSRLLDCPIGDFSPVAEAALAPLRAVVEAGREIVRYWRENAPIGYRELAITALEVSLSALPADPSALTEKG